MVFTHPKIEKCRKLHFFGVLIDSIKHIHMYLVGINAFETIVGVVVVSLPSKTENVGTCIFSKVKNVYTIYMYIIVFTCNLYVKIENYCRSDYGVSAQ